MSGIESGPTKEPEFADLSHIDGFLVVNPHIDYRNALNGLLERHEVHVKQLAFVDGPPSLGVKVKGEEGHEQVVYFRGLDEIEAFLQENYPVDEN